MELVAVDQRSEAAPARMRDVLYLGHADAGNVRIAPRLAPTLMRVSREAILHDSPSQAKGSPGAAAADETTSATPSSAKAPAPKKMAAHAAAGRSARTMPRCAGLGLDSLVHKKHVMGSWPQ
eukprot:CAMPEP_0170204992 /NCGR_PEP_ID=MMETSP0116_2-20130129/2031_1 /TAXON_ID=400756 /ORGANISM="Durinskia baltica, Strain CSIRO CS-38" /LENGTH=121 /DNA_ID=CAMNT_0010455365 /DNA_START=319 /DNA_END=682 /DNA_ORIENTATION=-